MKVINFQVNSHKEYVKFFVSKKILGQDGPLAEYGLVPLPKKELKEVLDKVEKM